MNSELPFGSTALKKEILDILADDGFSVMSPVQAKTIPLLIKGNNVLALAETGTGKTLAYALPILNDLEDIGSVQAVVLSPTVALLDQIKSVFEEFTLRLGFKPDAVKAIYSQNDFKRSKPDIVLITPDLYPSLCSHYPVNKLKRVIIDEGDMIAFDGFESALDALKKQKDAHMVSFFSASLNEQDVKRVKKNFCITSVVDVRNQITAHTVKHHLVDIRTNSKAQALSLFLSEINPFKAIAFVSTKEELYKVTGELKELGVRFLMVHGGLDKRDIKKVLDDFRKDDRHLLVATDYVSRGLDIPDVDCIISLDLSKDSDYYFHRAGRAGRFLTPGDSYVFYTLDDEEGVKRVKDLVRRGVDFDTFTLNKDSLKKNKGAYQFRNLGKKDRADSEVLQKKIRHAVNKNKSTKVKPGYKKKVRKAVDLVKFKHRRKIVLTNIAKNGGNTRDFHMDKPKNK